MKLVFVRFLNNLLRHFDKEHVFLNFLFLPFLLLRWYVVIGAEGILRCSTKSLLLLTINRSTLYTIHTYD